MNKLLTASLLILLLFLASTANNPPSSDAVVHAVLFYSPSCGHCHLVITETLPPLFEKYGEQLVMVGVDVSTEGGQTLFRAVLQHFELESGGVPFLVVGNVYLVGSADIPEKFPGLIDDYLALGGVDWPSIPGLAEALAELATTEEEAQEVPTSTQPVSVSTEAPAATVTPTPGLIMTGEKPSDEGPKFSRDPLGNSLSVAVLAAMVLSIIGGAYTFLKHAPKKARTKAENKAPWPWLFPILVLFGLGVAGYLGFVETAEVEAVCGPVGDCNAVQQSEYAKLFGFLHIGVLGVIGYVWILLSWILGRLGNQRMSAFTSLAILGMTTFGVLFSTYLTFLEPFVIGATCVWCLTSAVIMTALFWQSLLPGRLGLSNLMKSR